LDFEAPDSGYLGAQVTIRHYESSLSFDVPAEMPMSFMSSRLEGIWRRAPDAETRIVLSNTSSSEQSGTVTLTGQRARGTFDWDFGLKPHETRVVEISTAEVAAVSSMAGEIGGIRIVHAGDPGSVIAFGAMAAPTRGFSSSIRFDDPAGAVTQNFAAAHLMVGQPDLPGLPPNAVFASLVALRNTAESPITVAPRVGFSANGVSRSVALMPRTLLGGEIQELILNEELRAIGVRGPLRDVGLSLNASGVRGALLTRVLCVDGSGTQVFEPPVKDTGSWMNRSGIYPISLAGDERSVVHVKNTSAEVALFTVHLDFDGGSYALEVQNLEPYQERAFDIRALRDLETPDCTGRRIPKDVMNGRVSWSEFNRKPCIGRVEQYSASNGVSGSFSCGDPCRCGPNAANHWMTPSSGAGKVGDVTFMSFFMTTQDFDCYGSTEMGPYDITNAYTTGWTSSNAAIAKIGPYVSGSGKKITCMGPGRATVTANHTYLGFDGPDGNGDCFPVDEPFSGDCPMDVVDITLSRNNVAITTTQTVVVGQQMNLSAAIQTGQGVTYSNPRWTMPVGRVVAGYTIAADYRSAMDAILMPSALNSTSLSYYWLDGADNRMAMFCVTVSGKNVCKSAVFNVKRPTIAPGFNQFVTSATKNSPAVGVTVDQTLGFWATRLGGLPGDIGIRFDAHAVTPAGFSGAYNFVQLVEQSRYRTLDTGVRQKMYRGSPSPCLGLALDGAFPYPTNGTGGSVWSRDDPTNGPADPPPVIVMTEVLQEKYEMYLIFRPTDPAGKPTIWVPLARTQWQWNGQMTKTTTGYAAVPGTLDNSRNPISIEWFTPIRWSCGNLVFDTITWQNVP
jgi:hypothetical protein